jgi:hypothetical protein
LEPNAENTLLLYDNPDVGVRFVHSRRWRVTSAGGRNVTLDESKGSGLLITAELPGRVPTGAQFHAEVSDWLKQQKANIVRTEPLRRLSVGANEIEYFSADVELDGKRVVLDYYVVRERTGGATLAARLAPADVAALRGEVERVARSLMITPPRVADPGKRK